MTPEARAAYQARIQRMYPWACVWCHTSWDVQANLKLPHGAKVYRHSRCGHVLFWRAPVSQRYALARRLQEAQWLPVPRFEPSVVGPVAPQHKSVESARALKERDPL